MFCKLLTRMLDLKISLGCVKITKLYKYTIQPSVSIPGSSLFVKLPNCESTYVITAI